MDRLGGFMSIFSNPSSSPNDSTYQSSSVEIEPLDQPLEDEDMEDEEALKQQILTPPPTSEGKSFNFPGSGMALPKMSSLKSSSFFNFRGSQANTTPSTTEEETDPPSPGLEATAEIDLHSNMTSSPVKSNPPLIETQQQQPEEPVKSKIPWKTFSGIAKAKQMLQNMRSNVESSSCPTNEQEGPQGEEDDSSNEPESGGDTDGKEMNECENLISKIERGKDKFSFVTTGDLTKGSKEEEDSWEVVGKSKLEFVTMDGGESCCVCKAKYSFNPKEESSGEIDVEKFLPFNIGDVVLVWLPIDENGLFQGELLNGKKGLVNSDFVPQIAQKLQDSTDAE